MAVVAGRRGPGVGLLLAAVALAAAIGLAFGVTAFTSARTSSPHAGASRSPGASAGPSSSAAPVIPTVKVTPVGLVKGLQQWSKPITLHIRNGTLLSVKATDNTGVAMPGTSTRSSWVSTGQEIPNRSYQLQAYIRGKDGVSAYHTLSVTTAPPDGTIGTNVTLQLGKTVGVGFPIVVKFTKPVAYASRAAIEKAMTVSMSVPVTAGWHWFSSTEMHFRGQTYWPAAEQLVLHDHITDVQMAPGIWGSSDRDVSFTIGDAHVTTVDVATQHMTVTDNGKVLGTYPVSTGRAEYPTKGGVHLVLEKFTSKVMDSSTVGIPQFLPGTQSQNPAYYKEKELWATRISNGGAFVHFQPLTLKEQGIHPASHGCVNTNLQAAKAFYDLSVPGDVVNVVNVVNAPPTLGDAGMMDWNLTWAQWQAGSAAQS